MSEVGREEALAWFLTFQVLVTLVMLNMLLAIIMDVYTEVKGNIGNDAETLVSQSHEIFVRWKNKKRGLRLDLAEVLNHLGDPLLDDEDEEEDEESKVLLNVDKLLDKVPGMKQRQAIRILTNSQEMLEADSRKSQSMAEAMIDIQRIDERLTTLHGSVERLVHMNEMSTALLVSHSENRTGSVAMPPAPINRVPEPVPTRPVAVAPKPVAFDTGRQSFDTGPRQGPPPLDMRELSNAMESVMEDVLRRHVDVLDKQQRDTSDLLVERMGNLENKVARLAQASSSRQQAAGGFCTVSRA